MDLICLNSIQFNRHTAVPSSTQKLVFSSKFNSKGIHSQILNFSNENPLKDFSLCVVFNINCNSSTVVWKDGSDTLQNVLLITVFFERQKAETLDDKLQMYRELLVWKVVSFWIESFHLSSENHVQTLKSNHFQLVKIKCKLNF